MSQASNPVGRPAVQPGSTPTPSPYAHLSSTIGTTPYGNYPPGMYSPAPWPQFQMYTSAPAQTRFQVPPIPQRPSFSTYSALSSGVGSSSTTVPPAAPRTRGKQSMRGLFAKELRNLMYGFGDDRNPANDTVNVMEEILIEYLVDVCQTARPKGGRLTIDDLRRALSGSADAKKLARMEELLFMQEDIKRARAQFKDDDPSAPAPGGGGLGF